MDKGIGVNTNNTPPTLLPPADVVLLAFHGRVPYLPTWDVMLVTASRMVPLWRRIDYARGQLRDAGLPERERLNAAIIIDTARGELVQLTSHIDTWLEHQTMPDDLDEDIVNSAQPFVLSFGRVISLMAKVASRFDDDFVYISGFGDQGSNELRWAEMTWAYEGYVEDLVAGRRYVPLRRKG